MSDLVLAFLCVLLGLAVGVGITWGVLRTRQAAASDEFDRGGLRPGAEDVIHALKSMTIVLNPSDLVLVASTSVQALGLVRGQHVAHEELRYLVREVRRDRVVREVELELRRGPMGQGRLTLAVRVAALPGDMVLMLIEDRTHARRVEETRRDFVVNVSHELKTPVGGLALLAEAVEGARDDPEAVRRFASRMHIEADRLGRLVQEIVELSRLQVADTLHAPSLVDVNACITDAIDYVGVVASDRGIDVVPALAEGSPQVYGDAELLTTAVRNLVSNAVNYSEPRTRVSVTAHHSDEVVEIKVSDQGLGIPAAEQERIFERFYRVDAARSRATGGTGLGLAIVKHVCLNHGGEVSVWSEEGLGSTFTMRLPLAVPDDADLASIDPPLSNTPRKDMS
ncbi:sensor histidine kinase [Demetria terragena]|uniref:sensor histidine kinase n=1 Tax=Demetria terragena TaxID=63959 RepID=UPI0003601C86|nr:ATP-binding protein [Demetria terragena]